MKKICFLISLIFLTGCESKQVSENIITPVNLTGVYSSTEIYNLYLKDDFYTLKKYEPKENIYLGIFLEEKANDFISSFENETKITNTIYMYNLKLDEDFPLSWVLNCYSKYKTPFITISPPDDITKTYDTDILEDLSKQFGTLDIPMFVNFYPVTERLSISPETYKEFFKTAKTFFEINAKNVCFIWSLDYNLSYNAKTYYPGDEYTEWVGINISEDINENNQINQILNELDTFYRTFQETKPIAISSLSISHFSNQSFNYNISGKIDELERFLKTIPTKYPRIKMINYNNVDNLKNLSLENRQNYSISDNRQILKAYKNFIDNGKFSYSIILTENNKASSEKIKTSFIIYKINDSFYLKIETIEGLGYNTDDLEEYYINEETLYKLDDFLTVFSFEKIVDTENKNVIINSIK